jgi:hypothetical protein
LARWAVVALGLWGSKTAEKERGTKMTLLQHSQLLYKDKLTNGGIRFGSVSLG